MIGGIVAVLTAIWIYRTAIQAKTGNTFYWVAGTFVIFLVVQWIKIMYNAWFIDVFDGDVSAAYDDAGGLNMRDNSDTAGLQSGSWGTFFGIKFELLPVIVPWFVVALIRVKFMLKEKITFKSLFSGIKEMFIDIGNSFKVDDPATQAADADSSSKTKE